MGMRLKGLGLGEQGPGRGRAAVGSARPLESFAEDRDLDPEAFAAKNGTGFLLGTSAGLREPKSSTTTQLLLDGEDDAPAGRTADLAVVIFPLRPKNPSAGHLVAIGRDPQHDVVIPDISVSRFHAFAKPGDDGVFQIQDTGSTNGTAVNGASVPPRGAGPPTRLKPGDTVRLGQAEFTFADARAVREMVRQAT